ncbi:hypothetical protein SAMN04490192_2930 [Pseudomonas lundensis]|nr:hypothetical protein SAMN04490192_2930 [Pseudomonas lundensis]
MILSGVSLLQGFVLMGRHGESLPGHARAVEWGSYRESSLARFFDQASTSRTTLLLNMLRWR